MADAASQHAYPHTHTSTERETMEYQSISNRVQFVESTQQFLSTQPRLHFPFIP